MNARYNKWDISTGIYMTIVQIRNWFGISKILLLGVNLNVFYWNGRIEKHKCHKMYIIYKKKHCTLNLWRSFEINHLLHIKLEEMPYPIKRKL